jgi:hypothetical protein
MGTKGRDICLWLYFALVFSSILASGTARTAIFAAVLLPAASFVYYCAWYHPKALRKSKELGMNAVVLLPMNTFWAKLLLYLDGERMECFSGAYEVHIKGCKQNMGDYLKKLSSDLDVAANTFPGALFMWETSAPLPLMIRRMIRQGSSGTAFLKKGKWPVPGFPFTGRHLKKGHVKHGAIISKKEMVLRTALPEL